MTWPIGSSWADAAWTTAAAVLGLLALALVMGARP
jgi:hypothetical protein